MIRTFTVVAIVLAVLPPTCEARPDLRFTHNTLAGLDRMSEKASPAGPAARRSGERMLLAARPGNTLNPAEVIVEAGVGFEDISLIDPSCTKEYVKSRLGRPDSEQKRGLDYRSRYRMDFFFSGDKQRLTEIRLNRGFKGKLASGISMSSSMRDVFDTYGEPLDTIQTDNLGKTYPGDGILIKKGPIGKIYYQDEGLLFWFNGNRINQIVTFEKPVPVVSEEDTSGIVIEEGVGFDGIVVGSPNVDLDFIKSKLGEPDEEGDQYLDYNTRYGMGFATRSKNGPLWQIHVNKGFAGTLTSGVSLSSSKDEVFAAYGEPVAEEEVDDLYAGGGNRVLQTKLGFGRIVYAEKGLLFWFEGQAVKQIVIFPPRSAGGREGTSQDWVDWILDMFR